jgi:imidazolonepropionase-like amidohydrolase
VTAYALTADVLFDGSGGEPLEQAVVTVAGERIVSVEQRTPRWRPPRDTPLQDLEGCTLVPGLIDSHVHLAFAADSDAEEQIAFAQAATEGELLEVMRRQAEEALRAGQTTLRDCGAPGQTALAARRSCESGAWLGPRLLVAGRPITTANGHCHWIGLVAQEVEEVKGAVRELVEDGVDFVKVMATGGMMTPSSDPYAPQYAQAELDALVAEAHGHNRRVAAHVLSSTGLRRALDAGVDTIEHGWTITGKRQDIDDELALVMARAGTIGSVTAHHALRTLLREGDLDELRRRLAGHRRFRERGVRLVVHSDAGTPGTALADFAESVEVFRVGLGVTMSEAVAAATSTAAAALGIDSETGTIADGLRADLLAVDGDLRDDPRALSRVRRVIRDGRVLVDSESH